VKNKFTRDIKEAVLNALERLGGDSWLVKLGKKEAKAFATLLGKMLPLQIVPPGTPDDATRILREQMALMDKTTSGGCK